MERFSFQFKKNPELYEKHIENERASTDYYGTM